MPSISGRHAVEGGGRRSARILPDPDAHVRAPRPWARDARACILARRAAGPYVQPDGIPARRARNIPTMRIIVKEADVILAERSFDDEAVYIGSQPGCAVHLPSTSISPHHLLLTPGEDGGWTVESLAHDPAATVGSNTIGERRPLSDGDCIRIENYSVEVRLDDSAEARAADERLSPTDLAEIKKYPLPPGSFIKKTGDPVQLSAAHLPRVARAGLELGRCADLHQLVDVTLTHLLQGFRGRCAWVGLRREARGDLEVIGGRYASGESVGAPALAEHLRYRCIERGQSILIRRAEDAVIGSALGAPIHTSLGTLGMIYVDVRKTTRRLGTQDLDAFLVAAAQVGNQLEEILRQAVAQVSKVSSTALAVCREIQERLDPVNLSSWPGYATSAFSMAGQEVSGDVYDIFKVPGKDVGGLLLANVRAEGSVLPMFMSQVHAAFRMAMLHDDPPHVFMRALNYLIAGRTEDEYVGCFVVVLDPARGVVRHCRAGRIGAIVIDAQGNPRPFGTIAMPAAGVQKGFEYTAAEETLPPGDTLVLYTRGVTTAYNASGERFGEKRFINALCDAFGQPPAAMLSDLKADLEPFVHGGHHPDDMTVLLVRRAGE